MLRWRLRDPCAPPSPGARESSRLVPDRPRRAAPESLGMSPYRPRSSRRRYRKFVEDYKAKRLDALLEREGQPGGASLDGDGPEPGHAPEEVQDSAARKAERSARRRRYLREYFRWLKPHRLAVIAFIALAVTRAGLEMIEPLFMRFMVDNILLNRAVEDDTRMARLDLDGSEFIKLIVAYHMIITNECIT